VLNLRAMRMAVAKYGQETSSFSRVATTLDTFRIYGLHEAEAVLDGVAGVGSIGGFLTAAAEFAQPWTPIPIISGWAGASGRITPSTLAYFIDTATPMNPPAAS
jgi:microcystin degradation protein MlrC